YPALCLAKDRDTARDVQRFAVELHLGLVGFVRARIPERTTREFAASVIVHPGDDVLAGMRRRDLLTRLVKAFDQTAARFAAAVIERDHGDIAVVIRLGLKDAADAVGLGNGADKAKPGCESRYLHSDSP